MVAELRATVERCSYPWSGERRMHPFDDLIAYADSALPEPALSYEDARVLTDMHEYMAAAYVILDTLAQHNAAVPASLITAVENDLRRPGELTEFWENITLEAT